MVVEYAANKPSFLYQKTGADFEESVWVMITSMKEILPRPPWNTDDQTMKYELDWCQDEIRNLEADIRELQSKLYDKEVEIEELLGELEELRKNRWQWNH